MNHKARMLAAFRGDQVDRLPYVPRLDLWYLANHTGGTLPAQHAGRAMNEIARAEGWALYFRFADDQLDPAIQPMYLHRGIGLFGSRDTVYDLVISNEVEVKVVRDGPRMRVEYHTPLGMVSTTVHYDLEAQRLGTTIPTIVDPLIKSVDDYEAAGCLYEHLDLKLNPERFNRWRAEEMRDDGVAVSMALFGASPVNEIQRDLIDSTQFFFHYKDHYDKLQRLASQMEPLFERMLAIQCDSPAEVVFWGANYDDMITYPPYFEREISPWLRKVSAALEARGKLLMCHTDGENEGLMDLICESGMHIAESICPAPMTKLSLAEYYRRWSPKLTLFGGVPSTVVLPETSEADFEAYLDELFRAVAPGTRYLVGVADQVPPGAIFSRLQRIGERVEREGVLPLKAGAFRPLVAGATAAAPAAGAAAAAPAEGAAAAAPTEGAAAGDEIFAQVRQDVSRGKHLAIKEHVGELLAQGVSARDILDKGLIAEIDVVGRRMASGEAFIPEVLLAARAMSTAVSVLEPHLAAGGNAQRGRVLIGTVKGDMHDIGKNLVVTMLRGVGFEVIDLGVNVARDTFCDAVAEHRPDVIGLSALLTTTMMEMPAIIRELEARGLREGCRVFVGGAPVSDKFARQIGADGFAADAVQAVNEAKRLLTG